MFTKAPRNSFGYLGETAVIDPRAIKRRKTDLRPTSYVSVAPAQLAATSESRDFLRCSAESNHATSSYLDTSSGRDLNRSSPSPLEARYISGPGTYDVWAGSSTTRTFTRSTRDSALQDPYMPHAIAYPHEGPTSAAPKPKRKQIALVKEEESKLRREEREGTPHISEMENEEHLTSMSIQKMTLAGVIGLVMSGHLHSSGSKPT